VGYLQECLRGLELQYRLRLGSVLAELADLKARLSAWDADDALYRLPHIERQLEEAERARDMNAALAEGQSP
jgi:hypothetical protein